jgi:hypothetical protein
MHRLDLDNPRRKKTELLAPLVDPIGYSIDERLHIQSYTIRKDANSVTSTVSSAERRGLIAMHEHYLVRLKELFSNCVTHWLTIVLQRVREEEEKRKEFKQSQSVKELHNVFANISRMLFMQSIPSVLMFSE